MLIILKHTVIHHFNVDTPAACILKQSYCHIQSCVVFCREREREREREEGRGRERNKKKRGKEKKREEGEVE